MSNEGNGERGRKEEDTRWMEEDEIKGWTSQRSGEDSVCWCVCVYACYSYCGDINLLTHSHCGDLLPYGDETQVPIT